MSDKLKRALALVVAAVITFVLMSVPTWAQAWAVDGSDEGDNLINTQQMPDNSFLYDTSIYDLVNGDASLDSTTVQVVGEVVGDAVNDTGTEYAWITLSSQDALREGTISVRIKESDLDLIDVYGGYDSIGTTLQVQGEFHIACTEHEGSQDIHATTVKALKAGSITHDVLNLNDFIPGIVLCGVGVVLMGVYYYLRERRR